jgi:hypothetical protein
MPSIRIALSVEVDGQPVPGTPIVRRLTADEVQQFDFEKAGDADAVTFTALPADQLAEIQMLLLQSDKLITLRLQNQSDAGLKINPGGVVFLLNVDIDAGAGALNAKINSNVAAGILAAIRGLAGGT